MSNHHQKAKPADSQVHKRIAPKGFVRKTTLVSALSEFVPAGQSMLATNFSRVPDQLLGGFTSERELSDQIGAPVRIIAKSELRASIGLDPADRFIAEAERDAGRKC